MNWKPNIAQRIVMLISSFACIGGCVYWFLKLEQWNELSKAPSYKHPYGAYATLFIFGLLLLLMSIHRFSNAPATKIKVIRVPHLVTVLLSLCVLVCVILIFIYKQKVSTLTAEYVTTLSSKERLLDDVENWKIRSADLQKALDSAKTTITDLKKPQIPVRPKPTGPLSGINAYNAAIGTFPHVTSWQGRDVVLPQFTEDELNALLSNGPSQKVEGELKKAINKRFPKSLDLTVEADVVYVLETLKHRVSDSECLELTKWISSRRHWPPRFSDSWNDLLQSPAKILNVYPASVSGFERAHFYSRYIRNARRAYFDVFWGRDAWNRDEKFAIQQANEALGAMRRMYSAVMQGGGADSSFGASDIKAALNGVGLPDCLIFSDYYSRLTLVESFAKEAGIDAYHKAPKK